MLDTLRHLLHSFSQAGQSTNGSKEKFQASFEQDGWSSLMTSQGEMLRRIAFVEMQRA